MNSDASESNADGSPLERVSASDLTARVPEAVGAGVFATGVLVLQSPTEVMIDFVQGMVNPRRLAARVVMPAVVAGQFLDALDRNMGLYAETFGGEPQEPKPAGQPASAAGANAAGSAVHSAPAADAYSQIKVQDEVLVGAYANTVSITHTGSEFSFDFINRGYPRSVVTCRVCMAAPRVPGLRDSLRRSLRPA